MSFALAYPCRRAGDFHSIADSGRAPPSLCLTPTSAVTQRTSPVGSCARSR